MLKKVQDIIIVYSNFVYKSLTYITCNNYESLLANVCTISLHISDFIALTTMPQIKINCWDIGTSCRTSRLRIGLIIRAQKNSCFSLSRNQCFSSPQRYYFPQCNDLQKVRDMHFRGRIMTDAYICFCITWVVEVGRQAMILGLGMTHLFLLLLTSKVQ